jgi:hypothetical protein
MDFFTVPTATFRVVFVLVVLSHDRRRIIHVIIWNERALRHHLRRSISD